MTDQRFAFLIGTGRCGSTIVDQVLALHPDVGFISNVDDRLPALNRTGRLNNAVYRSLPTPLQNVGGRRGGTVAGGVAGAVRRVGLTPSEGYRLLDRHVSPMLSAPCRDLTAEDAYPWIADRLRRFFERRAAAQSRALFVHKFTGWPRTGLLHAVFPDAGFVHVVRDGRAVACSLLQQPWWPGYGGPDRWSFGPLGAGDAEAWERSGRSFAVLAGLEWKRLMHAFDSARAELPANLWFELRYEDVVQRPRAHVEELLGHVGLEWTPRFERAFHGLGLSGGRRNAYREELSARDVALLEDVLGPELAARGYA